MIPDVVIVGAGAIGLAIGHELCGHGFRVIILDAGEPGRRASWAAAGVLAPQGAHPHAGPYLSLSLKSRDMFPDYAAQLRDETGIDIEHRTEGGLHIALDDAEAAELSERCAHQKSLGLPVEYLTGEETRSLEPALYPETRCGLLFREMHQVENRRMVTALAAATRLRGGVIHAGSPVIQILVNKGRVVGVETPGMRYRAGMVILAAGAWSRLVCRGIDEIKLPVRPVKGQMVALDGGGHTVFHRVIHGLSQYLVPRRDGRILVGATVEKVGFDATVTAGGVAQLLNQAIRVAPGLQTAPVVETWAGLRPMSRDGKPILGPTGVPGLIAATGHYRNGILLTPVTARLVAEYVRTGSVPGEMRAFLPDRFIKQAPGPPV
jgi:glycine oxidase